MKLFGIIGAGGFGREIMPLAIHQFSHQSLSKTDAEYVFVVEDAYLGDASSVNGRRVLSMSQFLAAKASERFYNIAIANSAVRERISKAIPRELAVPFDIRATSFEEGEGNSIGDGAVFCNFTMVTSNARIGRFFQCNIYSYVAHDCVIGDYVTFAPGVKCNGHVEIEDHAYIGTGAIIKDGTKKPIVIGKGAVVGMGAVVTKSVPPGAVVIGNPAKPLI